MPVVEVNIRIAVEPRDDLPGISSDAEVLVDEIFYEQGSSVADALSGAIYALEEAVRKCEHRQHQDR